MRQGNKEKEKEMVAELCRKELQGEISRVVMQTDEQIDKTCQLLKE